MDSSLIILVLCGLVIISYTFEIFAKKTGIPAIIFLILLGMVLKYLTAFFETPSLDYMRIIPVIGTVGLILIVFEGALEIEYHKDKKNLFLKTLLVSIVLLTGTSILITFLFIKITGAGLYHSFLNAIPLSIISSAIAIPSASQLHPESREYITLESSLSDILGIVIFNYAVINSSMTFYIAGSFILEIIIVTAVSLIFCLLLLYLLRAIEHNIKFILILTVMIFLYTLGKWIHVSSLIMVLMFGLILKNINLVKSDFIKKHFNNLEYQNEFNFMQQITSEGVFLVKTFFFIIFGFIIHPASLVSYSNIEAATAIVCVIYGARVITLASLHKTIFPEVFYAPRGLITILLFLSIPNGLNIDRINIDVLFIVVLMTSIIMITGSFWRKGAESG